MPNAQFATRDGQQQMGRKSRVLRTQQALQVVGLAVLHKRRCDLELLVQHIAARQVRAQCDLRNRLQARAGRRVGTVEQRARLLEARQMSQHACKFVLREDAAFVRSPCPSSEEHTSELQSLMRISYAVFCLKKKPYTSYKS